jgi:galactokinase
MKMNERKDIIEGAFINQFGKKPLLWSRAPGRVDLMGSHTDYNEGFVLTMTINRDIWLAAAPRADQKVAIHSMDVPGGGLFDLDDIQNDQRDPWTNYVRGVAWAAQERGLPLSGFDGLIHSTVPLGSGVSSSAALEASVGVLLRDLGSWSITDLELALLCQKAENDFVGMNCGILDQYTSLLGAEDCAVILDCRHLTSETVPIPQGISIVICDTKAKRELTGSEYPERRAQCEIGAAFFAEKYHHVKTLRDVSLDQFNAHKDELDSAVTKRCLFIIEENQRVVDMVPALRNGVFEKISSLTLQSYLGARDLYDIGSLEYGLMMNAMLSAPGMFGARQAGAGFGGCMVAFVINAEVEGFIAHVKGHYQASASINPHVYPVCSVPGAGIIEDFGR